MIRRVIQGKVKNIRFQYGAELIANLNLYGFVGNRPINLTDPLGLESYGNPVSGPNGPVGPSNPYAPGEPYYPNGYLYTTPLDDCISRCMAASGAVIPTVGLFLGLGGGATVPKITGSGALGGGAVTTVPSYVETLTGLPLRGLGRFLNPYGDALCVGSICCGLGMAKSCEEHCKQDINAF